MVPVKSIMGLMPAWFCIGSIFHQDVELWLRCSHDLSVNVVLLHSCCFNPILSYGCQQYQMTIPNSRLVTADVVEYTCVSVIISDIDIYVVMIMISLHVQIVCMDCSSTLLPTYITNEIPSHLTCDMMIETGILDVMRLYLSDAVEFVSDLHTLLKLKVCDDKRTKPV